MNRWSSWTTEALQARFANLRTLRATRQGERLVIGRHVCSDMAKIGRELRSRGVTP